MKFLAVTQRTITIAAYRRADYLTEVLQSLDSALAACPEYQPLVIVGVDQHPDGRIDSQVVAAAQHTPHLHKLIVWPKRLGVDEHPRRLLQYAFREAGSHFNLHLEDDTVLSPDALRLAIWFQSHRPCTEILSLYHPSFDRSRPSVVEPIPGFSCWGWGVWYNVWTYLALEWNHRRVEPLGWDWSLTDTMHKHQVCAVAPVLSRVRNIGRERGEYQTPAQHDVDFAGQVQALDVDMQRVEDFRMQAAPNATPALEEPKE